MTTPAISPRDPPTILSMRGGRGLTAAPGDVMGLNTLRLIPVACALLAAPCSHAPAFVLKQPTGAAIGAVPPELELRWQQAAADLGVTGMVVVGVRGDHTEFVGAYGHCDAEGKRPVTPDSAFYIASCTKPIVACGVMMLVDQGKIELDAPVRRYLPRLDLPDESLTRSLAVRDLLTHAKGLDHSAITFGEAYSGDMNEDRYYRLLKSARVKGSWAYSNLHFTLAGRVIASVTGSAWRDFLEASMFKPAGMTRTTGYASRFFAFPDAAIPLIRQDGSVSTSPVLKTDETMHAAGGLAMSARDMARWLELNLTRGVVGGQRILSESAVKELQRPQITFETEPMEGEGLPGERRTAQCLGWIECSYNGVRLLKHTGGYIGARACFVVAPDLGIAAAAASNIGDGGGPMVEIACADALIKLGMPPGDDPLEHVRRELASRQNPPTQSPPDRSRQGAGLSAAPAAYSGSFQHPDWGRVEVLTDGDSLVLRLGALRGSVFTRGEDLFVCEFPRVRRVNGKFEMKGGSLVAVTLQLGQGQSVRFEKP